MSLEIRTAPVLRAVIAALCVLGATLLMAPAALASTQATVESVSPAEGKEVGGAEVVIAGTSFETNAKGEAPVVTFGGAAATAVEVKSSTEIKAKTPAHAAGKVEVCVTNEGASAGCEAEAFVYRPAPVVTAVKPDEGGEAGGAKVIIEGEHLEGTTKIAATFGAAEASEVKIVGAEGKELEVTTPAHAPGLVNVCVTTWGGTKCAGEAFTYRGAPKVTSVQPTEGPTSGGTEVTIEGTEFESSSTVSFGMTLATGKLEIQPAGVGEPATITVEAPASTFAGSVGVCVQNAEGSSCAPESFVYREAPIVTSISKTEGPLSGGTEVIVQGSNFVEGKAIVEFVNSAGEGTAARVASYTGEDAITAEAPPAVEAEVDRVCVITAGGEACAPESFAYRATPKITSISPEEGPLHGGTVVKIQGTGFVDGATEVAFGANAAASVTFVSEEEIEATTLAASVAGAVDVSVTTVGGTAQSAGLFSFRGSPVIATVSPSEGPEVGGNEVTIEGKEFEVGAKVLFGQEVAENPRGATEVSVEPGVGGEPATITAKAPKHLPAAVKVCVETAQATTCTATAVYTFRGTPTITSVTPNEGPEAGGTKVTIQGTEFEDTTALKVLFEASGTSVTATVLTVEPQATGASATIEVESPTALVTGTPESVCVETSQSRSCDVGAFTYRAAPTITSVTPNEGTVRGGTEVTIVGENFVEGAGKTTVAMTPGAAPTVVRVSETEIVFDTPADAAGAYGLDVETAGGKAELADAFTFRGLPTVTNVMPTEGSTNGGTEVTIEGTEFESRSTVWFGAYIDGETYVEATNVKVTPAATGQTATITATAPAHEAGLVRVCVENAEAAGGEEGCTPTQIYDYKAPFRLTVVPYGEGEVSAATSGVEGGGAIQACDEADEATNCSAEYLEGADVELSETPAGEWDFAGWNGCHKTSATTCTVTVSANSEVSAAFVKEGLEGKEGAEGPEGKEGAEGPEGAEGNEGAEGPEGAEGEAGPQGEPGERGLRGEQGLTGRTGETGGTGPAGATGPAGPAGPQGKRGPAGEIELVVCHVVKRAANGKKAKQKCKTKLVSGVVKFFATSSGSKQHRAHAQLSRAGKVYARGTVRDGRLVLHARSNLRHGRYLLTVSGRERGARLVIRQIVRVSRSGGMAVDLSGGHSGR